MDLLRTFWPLGLKVKKGDIISLLVWIVIGIVFCAIVGWLTSLVAGIVTSILPFLGVLTWIVGIILDIYGVVNIVVCVLSFLGMV